MSEPTPAAPLAEDDYLAPVPDIAFWNEAMATMVADPVTGISATLYISRWWGKPSIMRHMLAFLLPGDRALFSRNYGASPDGRTPAIAGFVITPQPDGSLHYAYDGPMDLRRQSAVCAGGLGSGPTIRVIFDLTFSSQLPIWDLHESHPSGKQTVNLFPSGHIEQLGKIDGTLQIGDERFTLRDAPTCRDHSRGVRDWRTHHSHAWLNAEFPSGWGFCAFRGTPVNARGAGLTAAAVFKDGKIIPATFESTGDIAPGVDIWRNFEITLRPDNLAPIRVEVSGLWNCWLFGVFEPGDLYWGAPTGPPDKHAFWTTEQSGAFNALGETGYGRVERCNRDIIVDDYWRGLCATQHFSR